MVVQILVVAQQQRSASHLREHNVQVAIAIYISKGGTVG